MTLTPPTPAPTFLVERLADALFAEREARHRRGDYDDELTKDVRAVLDAAAQLSGTAAMPDGDLLTAELAGTDPDERRREQALAAAAQIWQGTAVSIDYVLKSAQAFEAYLRGER